jgi:hypothetical protein
MKLVGAGASVRAGVVKSDVKGVLEDEAPKMKLVGAGASVRVGAVKSDTEELGAGVGVEVDAGAGVEATGEAEKLTDLGRGRVAVPIEPCGLGVLAR